MTLRNPTFYYKGLAVLLITGSIGLLFYIFVITPKLHLHESEKESAFSFVLGSSGKNFTFPTPEMTLNFPSDFYIVKGYRSQWWYFTGNLKTEDGHEFGYQFTLFRFLLNEDDPDTDSGIYSTHIGISDITNKTFYSEEKFFRRNIDDVDLNEEGKYYRLGKSLISWAFIGEDKYFRIGFNDENYSFDLKMKTSSEPIFQGTKGGYSQKGEDPKNSSGYFSFPYLQTSGILKISDQEFNLDGVSWFDRELSSALLDEKLEGWDWFALHLDNGDNLMVYGLRQKNGKYNDYTYANYIDANGVSTKYQGKQIIISAAQSAKKSSNSYPQSFKIEIPDGQVSLSVESTFPDQFHQFQIPYWEGAVKFNGDVRGDQVNGKGYMELTGYQETKK